MAQLTESPRLQPPTVAVRESWLAAERAHVATTGASVSLLGYSVAAGWRRQGHATAKLAAGLGQRAVVQRRRSP